MLHAKLRSGLTDWRVWVVFGWLQLTALRPLLKFLPQQFHVFIIPFLLLSLLAYASLSRLSVDALGTRALLRPVVTALLLLMVTGFNFFVYPWVDARQKMQGLGSDQDDALIQAAQRAFHGQPPYEAPTYLDNPISSGPGIIVYALPFATFKTYSLLTPCYLLLLCLVLRRHTGSWLAANVLLLLLASSLSFWELLASGTDMLVIGIVFTITTYCVCRFAQQETVRAQDWLWPLVLGALTLTTRAIFVYFAAVYLLLMLRWRPWRGFAYALAVGAAALLVHATVYSWSPQHYTPLRVITKGGVILGASRYVALPICMLAAYWASAKSRLEFASWSLYAWLCLAAPLLCVSLMDLLAARHGNLSTWEGANYLMLSAPMLLTYSALTFSARVESEASTKFTSSWNVPSPMAITPPLRRVARSRLAAAGHCPSLVSGLAATKE